MRLLFFTTHFYLLFQPFWWILHPLPLLPFYSQHLTVLVEGLAISAPGTVHHNGHRPQNHQKKSKLCGFKRSKLKYLLVPAVAIASHALYPKVKELKKSVTTKSTTSTKPSKPVNSLDQWTLVLFGSQLTVRRPLWWLGIIVAIAVVIVLLFKIVQFLFCEDDEDQEEEEDEEALEEGGRSGGQQKAGCGLRRRGRQGLYRLLTSPKNILNINEVWSKRGFFAAAAAAAAGENTANAGKTRTKRMSISGGGGGGGGKEGDQQMIKSVVSEPAVKLPSGSEIGVGVGSAYAHHHHHHLLKPVVKSPSEGETTNQLTSGGGGGGGGGGATSCTPPTNSSTTTTKSKTISGSFGKPQQQQQLMQYRHFSNTPMGSTAQQQQ